MAPSFVWIRLRLHYYYWTGSPNPGTGPKTGAWNSTPKLPFYEGIRNSISPIGWQFSATPLLGQDLGISDPRPEGPPGTGEETFRNPEKWTPTVPPNLGVRSDPHDPSHWFPTPSPSETPTSGVRDHNPEPIDTHRQGEMGRIILDAVGRVRLGFAVVSPVPRVEGCGSSCNSTQTTPSRCGSICNSTLLPVWAY